MADRKSPVAPPRTRRTSVVLWLLSTVFGVFVVAPFTPLTEYLEDTSKYWWNSLSCGGVTALAEAEAQNAKAMEVGEMMSESAQLAFANYSKSYRCGDADAGLMVAIAHCDGFGTPKNDNAARELLLEIEDAFPNKVARVNGARRHCGV